MKSLLHAAAALAASLSLGVVTAQAQTAERVYDNGPVVQIAYIETKPGMFDDYMAYLNSTWRGIQEAYKKNGDVLDYRVLAIDSPRDGEPDVILMTEYKNMAVFDRSLSEQEAITSKAFGTMVKANQASVSREALRTQRGMLTAREMRFLK